jgi:hypothetical protein
MKCDPKACEGYPLDESFDEYVVVENVKVLIQSLLIPLRSHFGEMLLLTSAVR